MSGGGYRAMLFHLGTLWRLNKACYLPKLNRISSVSGGSIVSAQLGRCWNSLDFNEQGSATRFQELVVDPIRRLASKTIDARSVLGGVFLPGSVSDRVERAYDKILFDGATLQDLPDSPRFVINATNVQSGVLWRFSKPYMWDYRVGKVVNPTVQLASAVTASSAFPPFLSPYILELEPEDFEKNSGTDLQYEPFTTDVVLTDGGVYDNLGLETVYKRYRTVLVSDAGGESKPDPEPASNWASHSLRVHWVTDRQVRSLRKRQLIQAFINSKGAQPPSDKNWRNGAYWGSYSNIANYELPDALDCPFSQTQELANIETRLKRLPKGTQERLINWGFAVCDAAMRKHVDTTIGAPSGFPYPRGVG